MCVCAHTCIYVCECRGREGRKVELALQSWSYRWLCTPHFPSSAGAASTLKPEPALKSIVIFRSQSEETRRKVGPSDMTAWNRYSPKSHPHFLVTKTNSILDAFGSPGSDEGPERDQPECAGIENIRRDEVWLSCLIQAYNIAENLTSSNCFLPLRPH